MNQTQRKFLIDKIEKASKIQIEAIEKQKIDYPSLSIYMLHKVMSGDFDIKSKEELKAIITEKALRSTDREDWLGNHWGSASKRLITFEIHDFFIVPEEWKKKMEETRSILDDQKARINKINIETETLITRIQLASDKVLQQMINEVDDMGNISLMDTKLKQLTA